MKKILLFLCWTSVLVLWACAASVYIDPSVFGAYFGLLGLAFPFCVAAVLFMAFVCLLAKQKAVLVPILGLVACYGSLRDYFPINLSTPPPKGCLKVMSYNTMGFSDWKIDEKDEFTVARYICSQECDLVNVQEATMRTPADKEMLMGTMKKYGYHYKEMLLGVVTVGLASRYPIVKEEVICQSATNGAGAFYVTPRQGDTIIVVNAHLESMHLSAEDRSQYHQLVKNPEKADTIKGKRLILSKIAQASRARACQADTLGRFLDLHKGEKIILTGDFNDTPISYAHHEVCSRLTDAYRCSGNGLGRSFNKDAMFVRIDNIFCSGHWKPFAARVDGSVPFSDHYPIIAYLHPCKNAL